MNSMFTDINLFKLDQQKFYDELRELNASESDNKEKKVKEINDKFRDKIRKYLPTCLNIINNNFGCQFSLYKVGKDFDASFKVIETNVKKSSEEVRNELASYCNTTNYNNFSQEIKEQIDLASEILITYVDDFYDPNAIRTSKLEHVSTKTSSIITNVPRMSQESLDSMQKVTPEMQYNPYANQPINLDDEFKDNSISSQPSPSSNQSNNDAQDNSNFSMDIFYKNGK